MKTVQNSCLHCWQVAERETSAGVRGWWRQICLFIFCLAAEKVNSTHKILQLCDLEEIRNNREYASGSVRIHISTDMLTRWGWRRMCKLCTIFSLSLSLWSLHKVNTVLSVSLSVSMASIFLPIGWTRGNVYHWMWFVWVSVQEVGFNY